MSTSFRFLAAAIVFSAGATSAQATDKLHSCNTDLSRTTVSGLSSGAYMAMQFQVANSSWIKGAGVIAGGPYNCAGYYFNLGLLAITGCMGHGEIPSPDISGLYQSAVDLANSGDIDPVEKIKEAKVYLFSGTEDTVVTTAAVKWVQDFYVKAGVPANQIAFESSLPSGHAFITTNPNVGNSCSTNDIPYVNHDCLTAGKPYDQPKAVLSHLYGELSGPAPNLSSDLKEFDQTEFGGSDFSQTYLASAGYVYVPKACENAAPRACKVHIVFHGCGQSAENSGVGDAVYRGAGYNRWADSNNIVVLYPQTKPTFVNFSGCWDWWGYTNIPSRSNYFAGKYGAQIAAVARMAQRLAGKR